MFFTLEYTERETRERLQVLTRNENDAGGVAVVASDDICADNVARQRAA